MSDKKILMHVDPNGVANIEAYGYTGTTCLDATRELEALFDPTGAKRQMKSVSIGDNPDHGETVNY